MGNKTAFNINNHVLVKLTDVGLKQWVVHLEALDIEQEEHPLEETDGFVRMQLWELMSVFGLHLYADCEPPFDTTIYLETDA